MPGPMRSMINLYGESWMWEIRIKPYFSRIQDYALWHCLRTSNLPHQYVDAQSMFAAIKARFGGNEATRKTQKALLKQQYENFNASSSESLDSIFKQA
ncbi:hypothetical protein Tco_1067475 [Tanacetum coccineum]|uniref:Uncharacterized protein n=1 Tax=Tanacetum coccineum TaxID=301880 RepID=A0ABQ5HCZ1_9ASTR